MMKLLKSNGVLILGVIVGVLGGIILLSGNGKVKVRPIGVNKYCVYKNPITNMRGEGPLFEIIKDTTIYDPKRETTKRKRDTSYYMMHITDTLKNPDKSYKKDSIGRIQVAAEYILVTLVLIKGEVISTTN